MITAELLRSVPLFATVPEPERESIATRAADVHVATGDWLIREGEAPAFFVLLGGRLEVLKVVSGHEQRLAIYQPGDYFGEVPLLLGTTAVASLRALEPVRVARLDPTDFHELIVGCPALSTELLRTMARRVSHLQQVAVQASTATVTVIGRQWDLACHDLRDFLARNHVEYHWVDPDTVPAGSADAALVDADYDPDCGPVVLLADGRRLVAPSYRELAEALEVPTVPTQTVYDVAIVGAGPAGLAAAVYGASEGLRTLAVERIAPGGQAGTSSRIENYLGFPAGISGDDLSLRAWEQARHFGADLLVARGVTAIELHGGDPGACTTEGLPATPVPHAITLDGGERVTCRAIVLATGVAWRRLDVPGIDAFLGRGVYYGAARTEARVVRDRDVYLVGGGNSAGQAAMLFASYARSVTILVRGEALAESMSQYLIDQLATKHNVHVETRSEVVGVEGDDASGHLRALRVRRGDDREARVEADALFVLIGATAQTTWLPETIARDRWGYLCTGRDVLDRVGRGDATAAWPLERDPFLLETSVPGIFAAGDVRHGSVKRVASAVGEGSMAIALVHQYFAEQAREPAER